MLGKRVAGLMSCFIGAALILVLAACNTANPQVVEVTRIVPQTVVVTQVMEKVSTPTSDVAKSSQPITMGIISGNRCYPSEGMPPMTIYARNVSTQMTYSIHVTATNKYEIQVPAESKYIVFAWSDAGAFTSDSRGGYYSCAGDFIGQMTYLGKSNLHLKCADADKEDQTPLSVTVRPSETTPEIYICDWSNQELVPRP